jgi:rhodanese-related sulfurtransferase
MNFVSLIWAMGMHQSFYRLTGLLTLLVSQSIMAELVGISPDQLEALVEKENALVVDIRTPSEWKATGTIASSHKLMFFDANSHYDSSKWLADLNRLRKDHQPVILICRSGGRSSRVGRLLDEKSGIDKIYHLEKGIKVWISEGKATQP